MDFKEFMTGLENMGIKLKYADYKLIFEYVDYDNEGEIDYNKFLLLNQDNNWKQKIKDMEWWNNEQKT